MVDADTLNTFKSRLNKHWLDQDILYNFHSELTGTGGATICTWCCKRYGQRGIPAPVYSHWIGLVSIGYWHGSETRSLNLIWTRVFQWSRSLHSGVQFLCWGRGCTQCCCKDIFRKSLEIETLAKIVNSSEYTRVSRDLDVEITTVASVTEVLDSRQYFVGEMRVRRHFALPRRDAHVCLVDAQSLLFHRMIVLHLVLLYVVYASTTVQLSRILGENDRLS